MKSSKLYLLPILLCIVVYYILNILQLLQSPPVWPDEAIYANVISNFIKQGKFTFDLLGETKYEYTKYVLWNPPLFFIHYFILFKFIPISIEAMRILSLTFGLLSIFIYYLIIKDLFPNKIGPQFLFLSLPIFNDMFLYGARFGRPDIHTLFYGILSVYCISLINKIRLRHNISRSQTKGKYNPSILQLNLLNSAKDKKSYFHNNFSKWFTCLKIKIKQKIDIITLSSSIYAIFLCSIAGISAIAAVLTHYIGFMYFLGIIIYFSILLITRTNKNLVYLFIFIISFTIPLFIYYVHIHTNIHLLLLQIGASKYPRNVVSSWLISLLSTNAIFNSTYLIFVIKIISSIIFLLYCIKKIIDNYSQAIKINPIIILYGSILFSTASIAIKAKSDFYLIHTYLFIYISLGIMYKISSSKRSKVKYVKNLIILVCFALLLLNINNMYSRMLHSFQKNVNYYGYSYELKSHLPNNKNVSIFLSSIPDPYFVLKNDYRNIYQFPAIAITRKEYLQLLNNSDYIIYNGLYEKHIYGPFLNMYINNNIDKLYETSGDYGYKGLVIKLKPRNLRIEPEYWNNNLY